MCRDNNHGGRRCPHDTSEKRQARRLAERDRKRRASALLSHGSNVWESVPEPVHYADLSGIKAEIESIQALIRDGDPSLTDADAAAIKQWDQEIEARLTSVGRIIAARAESKIGFRSAEFEAGLDELAAELYNGVNEKNDVLNERRNDIQDELEDLQERILDNYPDWTPWRTGGWSAEDYRREVPTLLTDEDQKILDRLTEIDDELAANREAYTTADETYDTRREEVYQRLRHEMAKAYQQVISEIRPTGGVVELSDASGFDNYEAEDLLARTVGQHYPTAWLDAHRDFDGPRMVALITPGRANYQPQGGYVAGDFEEEAPRTAYTIMAGSTPEEQAHLQRVIDTLSPDMQASMVGIKHPIVNDQNMLHIITEEHEVGSDNYLDKPVGDGWVFESSVHGLAAPGMEYVVGTEMAVDRMLRPRWHRPAVQRRRAAPVLRIYDHTNEQLNGENSSETSTRAVAYHEFGHRMEQVLPRNILPRVERAFLMRRSNKATATPDQQYANMTLINAGEVGYRDTRMGDAYMAREYFTGENYEVFTTGVEALYGEAYGGLQGFSLRNTTRDDEHRGFVLGALATL